MVLQDEKQIRTKKDCVSITVTGSAKPPPQVASVVTVQSGHEPTKYNDEVGQQVSVRLHWDGRSSVCHDIGPDPLLGQIQPSSFQVTGTLTSEHRARPYWTTGEISCVPVLPSQAIAWEREAVLATFSLTPLLFAAAAHGGILGATGELIWVPQQEKTASFISSVHPVLLVHTAYESLQAERVEIVPYLTPHDPLLQHIALVLQVAFEGGGRAGQLYAESLTDALVVHFLRRYQTSRRSLGEVTGGLAPYKLRRTIAFIKEHLAQELSLVTLAAVGETSPAHFARLFKHATGMTPHQYVIARRMEQAKQLLSETELSLVEISLQIGCTDQSHFTALFRKHGSMTPKAYRDHTRR